MSTVQHHDLNLAYGLKFADLYTVDGIFAIDKVFLQYLLHANSLLHDKLISARSNIGNVEYLTLIIELAKVVEQFIASLFGIHADVLALQQRQCSFAQILECRRSFIQRRVAKCIGIAPGDISAKIAAAVRVLQQHGIFQETDAGIVFSEQLFATKVLQWVQYGNNDLLMHAEVYAAWALYTDDGRVRHKDSMLFCIPKKINSDSLITEIHKEGDAISTKKVLRVRNAFSLNDSGVSLEKTLSNVRYCIHCHNQGKDSCSKGMMDKNDSNIILKNVLGVELNGCPLKENISEMNYLKDSGFVIAPLAVAVIENPMLAATGHRICSDCMRSCIYQKQEPVNIPLVETQVLRDVLSLPWGFEIYSLLTRWNPLNFHTTMPKPIEHYKVLVVGLGPAGFTLAHYLLNQGINVVAIDGLKIEPLPPEISGIDMAGKRHDFIPIKNVDVLCEDLNERGAYGFGGVEEYGITVRWDKNYLKIIRLLLERRVNFRMYGSTRFGSTITVQRARDLGFDHVALALGAGKPNLPRIPNILAKGVKTASDFLMALQLSGTTRTSSIANLQIELPIVVIGGGLTAVDAATESLNYYAVQVEKLLSRYEVYGEQLLVGCTAEEKEAMQRFIHHAKVLRSNPRRKPYLLKEWGGATIMYRKALQKSPAYSLNHEEVAKALEEGVVFLEGVIPEEILIDKHGHCTGIKYDKGIINARTILIAIGTNPNTVIASEEPEIFPLDGKYFKLLEKAKPGVCIKHNLDNISISCIGDANPYYAGSVVKAMASAKNGWQEIIAAIHNNPPASVDTDLFAKLDELLLAKIIRVERLAPGIVEVVAKAKLAALEFKPGQFFRLQNYESTAKKKDGITCTAEGVALTGASVDIENGTISTIVLENGASSYLCGRFTPGEIVPLMGPTGAPTFIPRDKNVMLVGGGVGNAVLFSIGKVMRENGCKVLYFACYKKASDRFKVKEIENVADTVVWCCEEMVLSKNRKSDYAIHADVIQAIEFYALNKAPFAADVCIPLGSVDYTMVIGSDKMMAAVAHASHNQFKKFLKEGHTAIASINSPMQCMMKEICAQCLQRHVDRHTGAESYVYSCFNQDQSLDDVDFNCLHQRLRQNSLSEKIAFNCLRAIMI